MIYLIIILVLIIYNFFYTNLELFQNPKKKIFILWFQGFKNAPLVVKKCLNSWKKNNPEWEIIELDNSNLKKYINIDYLTTGKQISKAALSDIIRISLLKKYGGIWVDATTYCMKPLNEWLCKYNKEGFFGFERKHKGKILSSWFLYGEKDNYIVNEWEKEVINYWKNHNKADNYFWFHKLFTKKYQKDKKFKEIWDKVPKLSASGPHKFTNNKMKIPINEEYKRYIDEKKTPLYKLSHHNRKIIKGSCGEYILNLK